MSPETIVQKAIVARLVSAPSITTLVPSRSILDRNQRPVPTPSIVIGEGLSRDEGNSIGRNLTRVYSELHVWKKEDSLTGVKQIAGEIRAALKQSRLALETGFHCVDAYVSAARFMRDPDGETSHAVVTVETIVEEAA